MTELSKPPTGLRDRLVLACLGLVPAAIARHAMFLLRTHPRLADEWGYHVRPIHFYEPLPDFREIAAAGPRARRHSPAIAFDLPRQRGLANELGDRFGSELAQLAAGAFDFRNGYFGGLDAAVYYAILRRLRPRRVIEIGAGFSTRIAGLALQRNAGEGPRGELVCVEPYPGNRLDGAPADLTLITQRVEHVDLALFDSLDEGDVLFIDSSHAVKFGGDVCREILDIVPRLKPGVWIHVHDIFFPDDYPHDWLTDQRIAWTEQYLLEAFLAFNPSFAPRAALHWLWTDHRDELRAHWPAAIVDASGRLGPGSFWMQRVG